MQCEVCGSYKRKDRVCRSKVCEAKRQKARQKKNYVKTENNLKGAKMKEKQEKDARLRELGYSPDADIGWLNG